MKNIILSENDVVKLIAKIYVDGSLRLVEKWSSKNLGDKEYYLTSDEMKILLENI